MRTYKTRLQAVFMAGVLLLGGCGKTAQETVPTLLEPVAANASFRPVELGTIGETKVLYGTVVPMEYCYFYDTTVAIKEIMVEPGDYVKEGDILAYADIAHAREELDNLNLQLENVKKNKDINGRIAQIQIAQIASEEVPVQDVSGNILPAADVSENRIDVEATEKLKAEKETTLAVAQENYRYDELLYEYRLSKLQEEMNRQQKIIADGTLRATHSGYVSFAKNLRENTDAFAYENIVVLADPEDTYIELTDRTIDKYAYEDYEVKYLRLAGKIYNVTEMSYGTEAEIFAKASEKYPNVRLCCPSAPKLTAGETYPIFYREKKIEGIPIIGLDSLKGEKDAYFVYVKTESGEKEKRSVTIGESDSYYAQVLGGLELGEMVYYESDARMPANYTEYTVELSDYVIENMSRLYAPAEQQAIWYDAEYEGTIIEVAVKKGETVEEGALLYVMRSDAGKAALTAAQNDMNQENMSYEENIKKLNECLEKEQDENARILLHYQIELANSNHAYRLNQLQKIYDDMAENNDGNGIIYVYAKQSGTVTEIVAKEETKLMKGSHVLALGNVADDKLLVQMVEMKKERNYPDNIAEFGENITVTVEEKIYRGRCVGRTAHQAVNLNKYYLSATEDGTAISYCTDSGYPNPAFYVEMEDESFYQAMPKGKLTFSYVAMEDVIVVPTAIVQEEDNAKNPTKKDYFMWRIVDGELVKQYVLINKAYSDVNHTVILSGVEKGDILARENK